MVSSNSESYFVYFPGDKALTAISVIIKHIEQSICKFNSNMQPYSPGTRKKENGFLSFFFFGKGKKNSTP
jgi:hypothetical protein